MSRYRRHYPDLVERDCNGDMPNLSFYKNEIRFLPNGYFIEDILQNWKDKYDLLEDNHSYIQWLFPLREPGVNWHAKPLTLREVEAFKGCREAMARFVQAYELMLGFYGIELEDRDSGTVRRAQNYQKRFQNLNWHSHNNLRITRILKSLGELGLERFQAPLARFFLEEALVRRQLPGVRQSALDYFMFAVRCRRQRRELVHFAWEHFRPRCKFVWGPHDKLRAFRPRAPAATAEREEDAPEEAGAQGRTCGPGRAEGGDPGPPSGGPQEAGSEEQGPESPKESKKRKLEGYRRAPGAGEQGAADVERIALNLEGCALSQGGLGPDPRGAGEQAPGEAAQPGPQPAGATAADDVRKRRKVEPGAPGAAPAQRPEPQPRAGESGAREAAAEGAPGSPSEGAAAAGPGPGGSEAPPSGPGEP
ncbi:opioid growth factor receptor isoform X2 [Dasypus novemcinctus]|nr:opioid growth factor receptor isoform X2 [Dasypus novemcinctus]